MRQSTWSGEFVRDALSMATNAPNCKCLVCGERLTYHVSERQRRRSPGSQMVFGPTDWEQDPHECPPGAIDAFVALTFRDRNDVVDFWRTG